MTVRPNNKQSSEQRNEHNYEQHQRDCGSEYPEKSLYSRDVEEAHLNHV